MTRRIFATTLTLVSLACAGQAPRKAFPAASPLPLSTPEKEGFSPARLDRMHEGMAELSRGGQRSGAISLIVRNGRIVDWRAWGYRDVEAKLPMERDTICRIYSMTKPITSTAVMMLYEEGRFELSDPVEKYIPELKALRVFEGGTAEDPYLVPPKSPLTIKHLLTHTSGMIYGWGNGPVDQMYRKAELWEAPTLHGFITRLAAVPLTAHPGEKWQYSVSIDVLGYLVEAVSGMPFETYLQQKIFEPLAMKDTHFVVPPEKQGRVAKVYTIKEGKLAANTSVLTRTWPSGGGGLFSTIGDYARFAQMLLNGGQLDGARVLGRKTVELMTANHIGRMDPPHIPGNPGEGFGLGGAVRISLAEGGSLGSIGQFGWSGAASTWFRIDSKEKIAAILFMQHMPVDVAAASKYSTLVYQAVVE